jgi:hypothetical protein
MTRLIVGGLLVFVLLGLYVFALITALGIARACPVAQCPLDDSARAFLLHTIGALVSAVVLSELAITKPKEAPGTHLAGAFSTGQRTAVKLFVAIYIVAWLAGGLFLVILGWVQHPTVPEINSAAKEWLGFAVAAGYAYFGLSPEQ